MIGTQIGSWTIESHLGKGGMGQVYLARHRTLDTLAAVKVLAPTLDEEEFRRRFFQEAKTQARLRHPNIAHVLDYIEQDGKWFLVVEYMEKGSLADHLLTQTQPLPALGAISYSRQALAGLGHAHEHGVVHRDVKPANLLLNERNEVAVTDFGIAMVEGEHRLTSTGLSVGTPRYMSPEQIMDPKGVDHRCDIYSMGIVLYQLLLGRVPFESDSSFEIQRAQVYETPPPMRQIDPRIPPELERIVLRALAKKAEDRFASCTEFAEALTAWFATSQPLTAPAVHYDATLLGAGEGPTLAAGLAEATARPAAPPPPPLSPTVKAGDLPSTAAPAPPPPLSPTVKAGALPPTAQAPRVAPPTPPVSAPVPRPASAPSRSSSKGLLVAVVLGVFLLLGGGAAFFFFRGVLPGLKKGVAAPGAAVEQVGAAVGAAAASAEQAATAALGEAEAAAAAAREAEEAASVSRAAGAAAPSADSLAQVTAAADRAAAAAGRARAAATSAAAYASSARQAATAAEQALAAARAALAARSQPAPGPFATPALAASSDDLLAAAERAAEAALAAAARAEQAAQAAARAAQQAEASAAAAQAASATVHAALSVAPPELNAPTRIAAGTPATTPRPGIPASTATPPRDLPAPAVRAEPSRPAAPQATSRLRATPRVLVVGAGEPALAAAAQDVLAGGLSGVGDILTARSVPRLADLLRGGASPGVSELLRLARAADVDVLVLADAQVQGDEVRSTEGRGFVALTSRLELSAFVVPSGEGLGPGWSTQVRYAAASAATYGGRAVEPLVPEIAAAVERGWSAYRASGP